jgi:hypothetical protein
MRFLLVVAAAAVLLVGGAAATLAISGNSLAVAGGSTTSTLPSVAPARTTQDVPGPCDEAEHANDARCAGTTATKPAANANRREDRAGHRHRRGGQQGRQDTGRRSWPGSGQAGASNRGPGRSDDDGGGHGGSGSGSGHGGGGRDHPEDD